MNILSFIITLLYIVCLPLSVQAETLEPIVLTSKQDIKVSEMIDGTKVILAEDIKLSSAHQLEELIKKLPGAFSSSTGAIGTESSIFIRGSESRHTLVLIDGVRIHDPSNVDRTLNLSLYNTSDIDRIEFVKGSQGVLYGSDAISGVINIITKKGSSKNYVGGTTGYYNQLRLHNTFTFKNHALSISAHYLDSEHLSVATGKGEKDLHVNRGVTISDTFLSDTLESETMLKITDNHAYTDRYAFTVKGTIDDKKSFGKDYQVFFKQMLKAELAEQKKLIFNFSFSQYERKNKYFDEFDSLNYKSSEFKGDTIETEVRIKDEFLDGNLIYGVVQSIDVNRSDSLALKEQAITGLFINHYQQYEQFIFQYGTRITHNPDFGDHLVYKAGVEREFFEKAFSLGGSIGTGFKAPSIFQQFAPEFVGKNVGNSDLAPEKSFSWEGFTELKKGFYEGRVTYFTLEIEDLIEYGDNGYFNSSTMLSKGVELSNQFIFTPSISLSLDMSFMNLEKEDGSRVVRRPEKLYALGFKYHVNDTNLLSVFGNWNGERYDNSTAEEAYLAEYYTVDVSYLLQLDALRVTGSLKNLFDQDYEHVVGYSTLGRSIALDLEFFY